MNEPADTFATFIAELGRAMDEPDVTGAELAERVHLSRYHFDRVVSAFAGEPPAALRRRVLLERAAYRLVTSAATVLDVAVEAGYSSHEAFTRAFARAYGRSPTQWRRRPSQVHLAGPSGVHFHPPGQLRLPAQQKVSSMDLLVRMVEHHLWLIGEMITRASTLTADQLDKPIQISVEGIDDHPTIRSLLSRLVGQMDMWNCSVAMREYDFDIERNECLGSLRDRLAEAGPTFLGLVREVSEQDRLDESFVDTTCQPPRVFSYGGMIAHVLTFAAHRRVLVVGALHDAGITDLGAGDPMQWVAASA